MDKNKNEQVGITSTYVENTGGKKNIHPSAEDHLHIRGEYLSIVCKVTCTIGSPPHTWRIHTC